MARDDISLLRRTPWNFGHIIGPKPPLKPKHIWAIRRQIKNAERIRDLALSNCALDAKLRGCDLVRLRVCDVAPGGTLHLRASVIQQKTGRPVLFEITKPTHEALTAWLRGRGDRQDGWLFPSRCRPGEHMSTRQRQRGDVASRTAVDLGVGQARQALRGGPLVRGEGASRSGGEGRF